MKSHVCTIGLRANPLKTIEGHCDCRTNADTTASDESQKRFNLGTCVFPTIEIK